MNGDSVKSKVPMSDHNPLEDIKPEQEYLTTEQAAAILGITRRFVYEYCKSGTLPHIKLSRQRTLIKRSAIEDMLITG